MGMARLIDVDALIAEYDRVHIGEPGKARKLMEDAPTIDAVPVEHAQWVRVFPDHECTWYWLYECSNCGNQGELWDNYCSRCGRKMRRTVNERKAD